MNAKWPRSRYRTPASRLRPSRLEERPHLTAFEPPPDVPPAGCENPGRRRARARAEGKLRLGLTATALVVIFAIAVLNGAAALPAAYGAPAHGAACPVIRQQSSGSDLVAIGLDHSGSMRRSDPRGERFRAVRRAVRLLALAAPAPPRVALVSFGTHAKIQLPATSLPQALAGLSRALGERRVLGRTDFGRLFSALGSVAVPAKAPLIVVVTDARPNGPGESLAGQFAAIRRSMAGLDGARVVLIVIDRDGGPGPEEDRRWRELGVELVRVGNLKDACLQRLLPSLVTANAGLSRRELELPRRGDSQRFVVPALAERVVLSAETPAPAAVELIGPNGRIATRLVGRGGIASVPGRPLPGTWQARLARGRNVSIAVDIATVRAGLIVPQGGWPQGAGLPLRARVTSLSGAPLPADSNLAAEAIVSYPPARGGRPAAGRPIPLERAGSILYTSAAPLPTPIAGEYKVALRIRTAGTPLLSLAPARIAVGPSPYLAVASEHERSRDPLTVPLELRRQGKAIDPVTAFSNAPATVASAASARLETPGGTPVDGPVRLRYVSGSRFEARFKTEPEDGRHLVIVATLAARERSGRELETTTSAALTARPTFLQRLSDILAFVPGIVIAVLIAIVVAFLVRPRGRGNRYRVPRAALDPSARDRGGPNPSVALDGRVGTLGQGWPLRPVTIVWMGANGRAYARWGRIPRRQGRVELELVGQGRRRDTRAASRAIPRRRT